MLWGTFSTVHISTLVFALIFIVIMFNILVDKSRKAQILSLFLISLVLSGLVIYNAITSENIQDDLPLNLWSLSALLLPYAVLTRQKWCCNLLILWPIQSLISLIFNYDKADMNVISSEFIVYFFTHVLVFSIPLLLFWLKLVNRDHKYIKFSLIFTALTYTGVHFANIALGTNYLYSMSPVGNELFAFFRTIFPFDYWYMYLAIPILYVYLVWWYLPEMLDYRRKRKRLKQKLRYIDKYYEEYEDEYIDEIIEEKYG